MSQERDDVVRLFPNAVFIRGHVVVAEKHCDIPSMAKMKARASSKRCLALSCSSRGMMTKTLVDT